MRIIGGKYRGRSLRSVPGDTTRPILDRVKTPLFDILRPLLEGASILDMFAGTGGLGIEALSQGASQCVFLDISQQATKTIKENLQGTTLEQLAEVRNTDAFSYIRHTTKSFDIIFVDPPQFNGLWIEAVRGIAERPEILNESGAIIVKIHPDEYEKLLLNDFAEIDNRTYGNSRLLIYRQCTK